MVLRRKPYHFKKISQLMKRLCTQPYYEPLFCKYVDKLNIVVGKKWQRSQHYSWKKRKALAILQGEIEQYAFNFKDQIEKWRWNCNPEYLGPVTTSHITSKTPLDAQDGRRRAVSNTCSCQCLWRIPRKSNLVDKSTDTEDYRNKLITANATHKVNVPTKLKSACDNSTNTDNSFIRNRLKNIRDSENTGISLNQNKNMEDDKIIDTNKNCDKIIGNSKSIDNSSNKCIDVRNDKIIHISINKNLKNNRGSKNVDIYNKNTGGNENSDNSKDFDEDVDDNADMIQQNTQTSFLEALQLIPISSKLALKPRNLPKHPDTRSSRIRTMLQGPNIKNNPTKSIRRTLKKRPDTIVVSSVGKKPKIVDIPLISQGDKSQEKALTSTTEKTEIPKSPEILDSDKNNPTKLIRRTLKKRPDTLEVSIVRKKPEIVDVSLIGQWDKSQEKALTSTMEKTEIPKSPEILVSEKNNPTKPIRRTLKKRPDTLEVSNVGKKPKIVDVPLISQGNKSQEKALTSTMEKTEIPKSHEILDSEKTPAAEVVELDKSDEVGELSTKAIAAQILSDHCYAIEENSCRFSSICPGTKKVSNNAEIIKTRPNCNKNSNGVSQLNTSIENLRKDAYVGVVTTGRISGENLKNVVQLNYKKKVITGNETINKVSHLNVNKSQNPCNESSKTARTSSENLNKVSTEGEIEKMSTSKENLSKVNKPVSVSHGNISSLNGKKTARTSNDDVKPRTSKHNLNEVQETNINNTSNGKSNKVPQFKVCKIANTSHQNCNNALNDMKTAKTSNGKLNKLSAVTVANMTNTSNENFNKKPNNKVSEVLQTNVGKIASTSNDNLNKISAVTVADMTNTLNENFNKKPNNKVSEVLQTNVGKIASTSNENLNNVSALKVSKLANTSNENLYKVSAVNYRETLNKVAQLTPKKPANFSNENSRKMSNLTISKITSTSNDNLNKLTGLNVSETADTYREALNKADQVDDSYLASTSKDNLGFINKNTSDFELIKDSQTCVTLAKTSESIKENFDGVPKEVPSIKKANALDLNGKSWIRSSSRQRKISDNRRDSKKLLEKRKLSKTTQKTGSEPVKSSISRPTTRKGNKAAGQNVSKISNDSSVTNKTKSSIKNAGNKELSSLSKSPPTTRRMMRVLVERLKGDDVSLSQRKRPLRSSQVSDGPQHSQGNVADIKPFTATENILTPHSELKIEEEEDDYDDTTTKIKKRKLKRRSATERSKFSSLEFKSSREKRVVCEVCHKSFYDSGTLQKHSWIHSAEKRFSCNRCGKEFSQKSNLKTHMRIHTGVKPFKCIYCGQGFSQKHHVVQHQYTHTGEKPFSCKVCGKAFATVANLKLHKAVHSREKPFKCPVCPKRFSLREYIKGHMSVHSAEKPFSCEICGAKFKLKPSLKFHMRAHSLGRTFVCSCDAAYMYPSALRKHMKQCSINIEIYGNQ